MFQVGLNPWSRIKRVRSVSTVMIELRHRKERHAAWQFNPGRFYGTVIRVAQLLTQCLHLCGTKSHHSVDISIGHQSEQQYCARGGKFLPIETYTSYLY